MISAVNRPSGIIFKIIRAGLTKGGGLRVYIIIIRCKVDADIEKNTQYIWFITFLFVSLTPIIANHDALDGNHL